MYTKNRGKVGMQKAGKMIFLHENQGTENAKQTAMVEFP